MIQDVDDALRALLEPALAGYDVRLSFEPPTEDWNARRSTSTLNLFLYDVADSPDDRVIGRQNVHDATGMIVGRRPYPHHVRLDYLVSAWAQAGHTEDEHRILAAALLHLAPHDTIPADRLRGSLVDARAPVRLHVGTSDGKPHDVWSGLGNSMRASFRLRLVVPVEIGGIEAVRLVLAPLRVRAHHEGMIEETGGPRR